MPLSADTDLFYDFLACTFLIVMIGVVLLAGWLTRTRAVIALAILLVGLNSLVLGAWLSYRIDGLEEPGPLEVSVLRLLASVAAGLLILAIWALWKLPRPVPPEETLRPDGTSAPPAERYDRVWLLSLLQSRADRSMEKIATPLLQKPSGESRPAEP